MRSSVVIPVSWQFASLVKAARGVVGRRSYLPWLAFWTLLVLSESLSSILSARSVGLDRSWQRALAWNVPQFYLWMLLAPCISWLGRRTVQAGWLRLLSVHVPVSVAMAAGQTLAMLAAFWQLQGGVAIKQHRQQYYDELNAVRASGDYEHWIDLFAEAIRHSPVIAVRIDD